MISRKIYQKLKSTNFYSRYILLIYTMGYLCGISTNLSMEDTIYIGLLPFTQYNLFYVTTILQLSVSGQWLPTHDGTFLLLCYVQDNHPNTYTENSEFTDAIKNLIIQAMFKCTLFQLMPLINLAENLQAEIKLYFEFLPGRLAEASDQSKTSSPRNFSQSPTKQIKMDEETSQKIVLPQGSPFSPLNSLDRSDLAHKIETSESIHTVLLTSTLIEETASSDLDFDVKLFFMEPFNILLETNPKNETEIKRISSLFHGTVKQTDKEETSSSLYTVFFKFTEGIIKEYVNSEEGKETISVIFDTDHFLEVNEDFTKQGLSGSYYFIVCNVLFIGLFCLAIFICSFSAGRRRSILKQKVTKNGKLTENEEINKKLELFKKYSEWKKRIEIGTQMNRLQLRHIFDELKASIQTLELLKEKFG